MELTRQSPSSRAPTGAARNIHAVCYVPCGHCAFMSRRICKVWSMLIIAMRAGCRMHAKHGQLLTRSGREECVLDKTLLVLSLRISQSECALVRSAHACSLQP